MKKLLSIFTLMLLMSASDAWAQPWTSGSCTVTLNNGTLTVSGKGAMADYLEFYGQPWNNNRNDITSVVVESGVTTVGDRAFHNFESLTSVNLPEGLTTIGERTFQHCAKLTSVTIPSTVTSIGADAFYGCISMTDVYLYADPANLTWNEDGCDDFKSNKDTKCHVLAEHLSAYETKFNGKVNVTFVGDLKPLTPSTSYSATMKDGVKDADKWTVKVGEGQAQALPIGGLKGDGSETVTLTYTGRLKVKGVKATSDAAPAAGKTVDLSTLTADYEAQDGDVLTGTLGDGVNVKITIADGATVTLSGAVINGTNTSSWAGLTLAGDGTIILSGENSVKGFYEDYPGISVPANKTLTIQGDGSLTASSNGYGAGIGGGWDKACGNITIEGGTVSATGGNHAAGIGGGRAASCGDISITGGTVTATGGNMAAGIGGGYNTSCGNITIANTVTKVTATKGDNATNSIGKGYGGTCGTVTIGGNVGAITESPYTYQPSN